MQPTRADRIGEMMKRELSEMIQRELKDPGVGFVSVTRVDVSRDFSVARVYVSLFESDERAAETMAALGRASGYLRGEVGRRLKLRRAPELDFRRDDSIRETLRLSRLMDEVRRANDTKPPSEE
jgi:ribosome-binding factor A